MCKTQNQIDDNKHCNLIVAVLTVVSALLLGFDITWAGAAKNSALIILAGLTTIALAPLMMLLTMLFRSFIPAMVVTVVGTIAKALLLSWEKSYLSPWTLPADINLILVGHIPMDIIYPITSLIVYFIIFMVFTLFWFRTADQSL